MSTGRYVYHCRKCGERYRIQIETSPKTARRALAEIAGGDREAPRGMAMTIGSVEVHRCINGGLGLADLIGWE